MAQAKDTKQATSSIKHAYGSLVTAGHSHQEVPTVQVRGRDMGNKLLESIYM